MGKIFPDPLERGDECYRRISGRLPSITVELTDVGEVESGELRWPPEEPSPCTVVEDLFKATSEQESPRETQPGLSEATPPGKEETEQKEAETRRDGGTKAVSLPHKGQGQGVAKLRN
ncbi:protein LBH-like [Rhincodon typus]|uniref:protein LBH-like n=1 Tax=Rhincodon typus TaxID=259920 RepID=UPI00202DDEBE|nr:protein LBH-like [Rhincodon typus]